MTADTATMNDATLARFWAKVDKDPEMGCWLWTAANNGVGYGRFWVGGKMVLAHRFAWELENGPIPTGLELDHLCRVRACVNPDHLEPVDHRVNLLRGDTIPAVNAAKTECIHGHPFDGANTYRTPDGRRGCRTCDRIRRGGYRIRQKAVVA